MPPKKKKEAAPNPDADLRPCRNPSLAAARSSAVARFSGALLGRGLVSRRGAFALLNAAVTEAEDALPPPPHACSAAAAGGACSARVGSCAAHCACAAGGAAASKCTAALAVHVDMRSAMAQANASLRPLGLALRKVRCEQTVRRVGGAGAGAREGAGRRGRARQGGEAGSVLCC